MSIKSEINFSCKLLNIISLSMEKSTIFAPPLISNALAMTLSGSDGITADELANIIGDGQNEEEIIEYYSNFIQYCKTLDDGSNITEPFLTTTQICYKLLISNCLFISNDAIPQQRWKEIMDKKFDGNFEAINYRNTKQAVENINNFFYENTEGKINNIINESDIDEDTVLFIVNALHFQGFWKKAFDAPKLCKFYSNNGKIRDIEMITHEAHMEEWNLTEGKNWKCLGIPFKTCQSWLHILLPNKNEDFEEILKNMDYLLIQECIAQKPVGNVLATIPAFQIESDFDLKKVLQKMGLINAFKDKYGIREMLENTNAYISKAIHNAGIKVDQYGTFGYAATAFAFKMQAFQKQERFIADRPFIFFVTLVSDQSPQKLKNILLMGTFC